MGSEIYGRRALWNGFRTPALIRFVPGEEFYLSNTHGGPRMYINLEVRRGAAQRSARSALRSAAPCGGRTCRPHPAPSSHPNLPSLAPSLLQDYISHQTGKPNTEFLEVMKLFRNRWVRWREGGGSRRLGGGIGHVLGEAGAVLRCCSSSAQRSVRGHTKLQHDSRKQHCSQAPSCALRLRRCQARWHWGKAGRWPCPAGCAC